MGEFTELQNCVNKLDKLQILLITLETQYMVERNGTDGLKNDTDVINYVKKSDKQDI
jgi:hypothetical protein